MQLIGMSSMTSFPWQAEHRAASVGEPFERQPTDYARRLPQGWMKNMLHADQLWIGKTIFASKGKLVTSLHPWYHPPALSVPKGCPKVDNYFLRRIFLWMPRLMWQVNFKCPRCDPSQSLNSKVMKVTTHSQCAADIVICTVNYSCTVF